MFVGSGAPPRHHIVTALFAHDSPLAVLAARWGGGLAWTGRCCIVDAIAVAGATVIIAVDHDAHHMGAYFP